MHSALKIFTGYQTVRQTRFQQQKKKQSLFGGGIKSNRTIKQKVAGG
jgi:hypothetical protein